MLQLVGGFNPSEKYARQIGSFPQVGMKIKNPPAPVGAKGRVFPEALATGSFS